MLALDAKINSMMQQRSYIKKKLEEASISMEGDPSFIYEGQLFLENQKFFEEEGYVIVELPTSAELEFYGGKPAFLFIISNIELSEEDLSVSLSLIYDSNPNPDLFHSNR